MKNLTALETFEVGGVIYELLYDIRTDRILLGQPIDLEFNGRLVVPDSKIDSLLPLFGRTEELSLDFSGRMTLILGLKHYQPMIVTVDDLEMVKSIIRLLIETGMALNVKDEGYSVDEGNIYQEMLP